MGNKASQSVCDETVYILVLLQAIDSNSAKIMLQPSYVSGICLATPVIFQISSPALSSIRHCIYSIALTRDTVSVLTACEYWCRKWWKGPSRQYIQSSVHVSALTPFSSWDQMFQYRKEYIVWKICQDTYKHALAREWGPYYWLKYTAMITRVYMKILGTVETTKHVNSCFKEPFILLFSSYDIVLQLVEW